MLFKMIIKNNKDKIRKEVISKKKLLLINYRMKTIFRLHRIWRSLKNIMKDNWKENLKYIMTILLILIQEILIRSIQEDIQTQKKALMNTYKKPLKRSESVLLN